MRGAVLLLAALPAFADPRPDLTLADFEGTNYGGWRVEGQAFGAAPAQGTLPHQMPVSGYRGHGLVNSYFDGDGTTGRLVSPEFTIERKFITFLVGGGGWADRTCMNLIVGTGVVRTVTGPNTEPGGSEALAADGWEVSAWSGRMARLEIVDAETGGWGHINVDEIVQSDQRPPAALRAGRREREIALEKRYLLLPVKHGAKHRVALLVDGAVVRDFDLELSAAPDWYAHLDVSGWLGRRAVLRADGPAADATALDLVVPSDELWNSAEIYREPLRGQFHFSARRGWLNDPNGLVFADGEYHLYFQHNPYGWSWGNMHWGHATSRDLVHWQEQPIALCPRQHGDWAYSGSAVVDRENTSGWRTGTNELIVAAFTSTARGECIVYSNDRGRTFAEFAINPVVKHAGRDPRLLWHDASRQWVMAVYDEFQGGRYIAFHTSPDLKAWTFQSRIEGFYECPDVFALPVAGATKWVLTAASSEYMVGQFDGRVFHPETPKLPGHRGRGFYAAQTFSHDPQGRVIQVGWLQTETRGMPFNQSMSLPNELRLRETPAGPRLCWRPVRELESLRAASHRVGPLTLRPGAANPLADVQGELLEIRADFAPGDAAEIAFHVRGAAIVYDVKQQELAVNGHRVPAPLRDGRQRMVIYADRTALEIYASDGLTYVPIPFLAKPDDLSAEVVVKGGAANFVTLEAHELTSAWERTTSGP